MSGTIITSADPLHGLVCAISSLRFIEHYEVVVYLTPALAPGHDSNDVAGVRSWSHYYCTACRTEFPDRQATMEHVTSVDLRRATGGGLSKPWADGHT